MNDVTIVIPNRAGETPMLTIQSLYKQRYQHFDIILVNDFQNNANMARNHGLSMVKTEFVLFSDNDINWYPLAIEQMHSALLKDKGISYAYGAYEMGGALHCNKAFDRAELRRKNYISTMTLVRTVHHPGWDNNIKRLQDWDVWLTMLSQGHSGKYLGQTIFSTPVRNGITRNSISWEEAVKAIKQKHNL